MKMHCLRVIARIIRLSVVRTLSQPYLMFDTCLETILEQFSRLLHGSCILIQLSRHWKNSLDCPLEYMDAAILLQSVSKEVS